MSKVCEICLTNIPKHCCYKCNLAICRNCYEYGEGMNSFSTIPFQLSGYYCSIKCVNLNYDTAYYYSNIIEGYPYKVESIIKYVQEREFLRFKSPQIKKILNSFMQINDITELIVEYLIE